MLRARNWFFPVLMASALMAGHNMPLANAQEPAALEPPEEEIEQIKLNEGHITSFLAALPDVEARGGDTDVTSEKEEDKLRAALDQVVAKHGFKDLHEFDLVGANIILVMSGIDPETGEYVDPRVMMKQDKEDIKTDKKLSANERKKLIEEIDRAMEVAPKLKYPENIDLVKKHRKDLDEAIE